MQSIKRFQLELADFQWLNFIKAYVVMNDLKVTVLSANIGTFQKYGTEASYPDLHNDTHQQHEFGYMKFVTVWVRFSETYSSSPPDEDDFATGYLPTQRQTFADLYYLRSEDSFKDPVYSMKFHLWNGCRHSVDKRNAILVVLYLSW